MCFAVVCQEVSGIKLTRTRTKKVRGKDRQYEQAEKVHFIFNEHVRAQLTFQNLDSYWHIFFNLILGHTKEEKEVSNHVHAIISRSLVSLASLNVSYSLSGRCNLTSKHVSSFPFHLLAAFTAEKVDPVVRRHALAIIGKAPRPPTIHFGKDEYARFELMYPSLPQ